MHRRMDVTSRHVTSRQLCRPFVDQANKELRILLVHLVSHLREREVVERLACGSDKFTHLLDLYIGDRPHEGASTRFELTEMVRE